MLNSLQACRAFACLLVVLYHTDAIFNQAKYFSTRPFGTLFNGGPIALDLLFVLSGFIILHTHRGDLGKPERIGNYLYRRLHRVYPTYWVLMACLLPAFLLVPSFGDGSQRDLGVVLRSIFFFPQPTGNPVLVVSWSLSLEIVFYLVFGALVVHRGLGLLVFAAWGWLLFAKPWSGSYPFDFLHNPYFIPILGGMIASEVSHRCKVPAPGSIVTFSIAALTGVAAFDSLERVLDQQTRQLVLAGSCMTLLVGLVALDQAGRIRTPRFVVLLGDASYSIYLIHYPVLSVLCKLAKTFRLDERMPHQVLFLGMAAASVGVGVVFAKFVERPLRKWGQPKRLVDVPTPMMNEIRRAA